MSIKLTRREFAILTAGDADLTGAVVGMPRAGSASLLPRGINWLSKNRIYP